MFNEESAAQLKAAGEALETMFTEIENGIGFEDASAAFAAVMATQAVVDEIKADKVKAFAAIFGAGLSKFGTS